MSVLIATGRLGNDAELKTTQGGTKVLAFSVADEIGWGDRKRTNWLKCAMFGDRCEKLAQYMTKGTVVMVTGEPEAEAWSKEGQAKGCIKVTVNDVKLFGGPDRSEKPAPTRREAPRTVDERTTGGFDDEVPF